MLKIIGIILLVIALAIVGLASSKPDRFQVERSIKIKLPASEIFPLVNDLRQWDAWSPWAKKDPNMQTTMSGAASGVGSVYEWSGNKEVGKGRMEIVDMTPSSNVQIKIDFIEPFATTNMAQFIMVEDGDFTDVSWHLEGPMPLMSKIFSLFVTMDEMVGGDFETGLVGLKALAEQ